MTPELAFRIVNAIAFFSWVYLIAGARWTPRIFAIVRYAIPIFFALVYIAALATSEPNEDAGFSTLAEVTAIFTSPWGVVGAWIHYLAFDFFVGCWILKKSKREKISHWLIVIPMVFTFLLGPVGLLLFLIIWGIIHARRGKQKAALTSAPGSA